MTSSLREALQSALANKPSTAPATPSEPADPRPVTNMERVFNYVKAHPKASSKQVSEALGIANSSVSSILSQLEKRKMVKAENRLNDRPENGRIYVLGYTALAADYHAGLANAVTNRQQERVAKAPTKAQPLDALLDSSDDDSPQVHVVTDLRVGAPEPAPAPAPATSQPIDVSQLTLDEAFRIYNELCAYFGGNDDN